MIGPARAVEIESPTEMSTADGMCVFADRICVSYCKSHHTYKC